MVDSQNNKTFLELTKIQNLKHFCMENLPRQLVCCHKSKNEIALDRARKLMESEIDIISLIKSRRYMKAALRDLLPDWRIAELKSQSYFVSVNPDLNTDSDSENDS